MTDLEEQGHAAPWELSQFVREVTARFPDHKTLTALVEMTFDRDNPDESMTLHVNDTQRHDRTAIGTFEVSVVAPSFRASFYLRSVALATGTPWELAEPILFLCRQHDVPVE